jgi:hypothetical protein
MAEKRWDQARTVIKMWGRDGGELGRELVRTLTAQQEFRVGVYQLKLYCRSPLMMHTS